MNEKNVIYLGHGNFFQKREEYDLDLSETDDIKDDIFDESRVPKFDYEAFLKIAPIRSKNQTKKLKQAENSKQLKKWFDLPRQEITDDVKMFSTRSAWDSKKFYKGDDRAKQTEYFQRGVISKSIFTDSNSSHKVNKNTDIIDNLLQSETLKRKMKKFEQTKQLIEKQKWSISRSMKKKKERKEKQEKSPNKKKHFKKN